MVASSPKPLLMAPISAWLKPTPRSRKLVDRLAAKASPSLYSTISSRKASACGREKKASHGPTNDGKPTFRATSTAPTPVSSMTSVSATNCPSAPASSAASTGRLSSEASHQTSAPPATMATKPFSSAPAPLRAPAGRSMRGLHTVAPISSSSMTPRTQ